jgi:membrane protein
VAHDVLLLAGRIPWRELFPSACATSMYYLGMGVAFSFTASNMVTSNSDKYGPIGVVIILGAVTDIV